MPIYQYQCCCQNTFCTGVIKYKRTIIPNTFISVYWCMCKSNKLEASQWLQLHVFLWCCNSKELLEWIYYSGHFSYCCEHSTAADPTETQLFLWSRPKKLLTRALGSPSPWLCSSCQAPDREKPSSVFKVFGMTRPEN